MNNHSPIFLADLEESVQHQFVEKHRKSFPDIWDLFPEDHIMSELHSMDLRFLMMADATLDEARSKSLPIWAIGVKGQVCIGDVDLALFIILAGMDNGFKRQDPETHFSIETFPWGIGPNDALPLARILRTRMKKDCRGRAQRMFDALIALLMRGPVSISPGPEPTNDDLFFEEPKRPPHLESVVPQDNERGA
jgi:hypothetical protein